MKYTALTGLAMKICYEAHKGQTDKGGIPYVFHPYHLAEQMTTENEICTALLHDVIEDTDCTEEQLSEYGFPKEVVEAVVLLTRTEKDKDYLEYVKRIGTNPLARKVKLADMRHNSEEGRIEHPTRKDLANRERYREGICLLEEEERLERKKTEESPFSRTERLLGQEAMDVLKNSHVAVFGIGGVGGYAAEALARSGVGRFDLIDQDTVSISNLNRQIIATRDTIGRPKAEVMKERILSINPDAEITVRNCFFSPENADEFPFSSYSFVVDAVDTITAKIALILQAKKAGVPVISSMGAGNKLDASMFRAADIYDTQVCPLAKVMRHELKKRGVTNVKVVYSEELPLVPAPLTDREMEEVPSAGRRKKDIPGSTAVAPSAAGLVIAGEVIKSLTGIRTRAGR